MLKTLRSFLYGKWFFGLLFLVSLLDVLTDISEYAHPRFWNALNGISLGFSAVVCFLAAWIFIDLHTRRPK